MVEGLGLASIMATGEPMGAALAAPLGLPPTDKTQASRFGGLSLLPTGPGVWLAVQERAPVDWSDEMEAKLKGLAGVSDQSSAYRTIEVSGADAERLLQRGVYVDLDESVFGPSGVVVSSIAHIGVILWKNGPHFRLAIPRSFFGSFQAWMRAASASL
jgi:sarcosine oxidase subunit gamma